jgi:hypothetical protein
MLEGSERDCRSTGICSGADFPITFIYQKREAIMISITRQKNISIKKRGWVVWIR